MGNVMFIRSARSPTAFGILANAGNANNLTTFTFAGVSFGTPDLDRYLFAAVTVRDGNSSSGNVTGVTIGGVAATKLVGQVNASGSICDEASIWVAKVPNGTSGNVDVTWTSAAADCALSLYRGVNVNPVAHDTAVSVATPMALNIDIPARGFVIGCGCVTAETSTGTWVGLSEDADFTTDSSFSGSLHHYAAQGSSTPGETNRTVSLTVTIATRPCGVAVSFGPL